MPKIGFDIKNLMSILTKEMLSETWEVVGIGKVILFLFSLFKKNQIKLKRWKIM